LCRSKDQGGLGIVDLRFLIEIQIVRMQRRRVKNFRKEVKMSKKREGEGVCGCVCVCVCVCVWKRKRKEKKKIKREEEKRKGKICEK
jgi:hypothetical protein